VSGDAIADVALHSNQPQMFVRFNTNHAVVLRCPPPTPTSNVRSTDVQIKKKV
jgi:hypothetical protein